MFTGIIQDLAKIEIFNNHTLILSTNLNLDDCKIGTSISCNGVCLTVVEIKKHNDKYLLTLNLGEETIKRTNFGSKKKIISTIINLEKSLKLGDEISGHFIYGHVDTTTIITDIVMFENSWEFKFDKKFKDNKKFITQKASVSINGISLTIAHVDESSFSISIIPHTFNNTNLQFSNIGDFVNVEFDYLARFLRH